MPLTTCLWFDTEAAEAAAFYASLFPNTTVGSTTNYGPENPERNGTPMTVEFQIDGQQFVGLNGGPDHQFTEAVSFQVPCASQGEVDRYWSALSEAGEPGPCGWIKDRWGVSWQIIPNRLVELLQDPDSGRAHRALMAMLQMSKIDIEALEAAADSA